MIAATLYIVICTARNRLRRRLMRLREPRYLIGAIVGFTYLYVTLFFRAAAYRVRTNPGAAVRPGSVAASFAASGPPVAGLLLACAAAACWLLPFSSSLLNFSQAEISLLFPAPVTRRGLVLYRLIRSQFAVMIGALIVGLAYPTGSLPARLRGMAAMWLLLMTSHVFFTGANVARNRFRQGGSQRIGAWFGLLLPVASVVTIAVGLLRLDAHAPLNSARTLAVAAASAATRPLAAALLWPFTSIVRPLFESGGDGYLSSLLAAASVYAAAVGWLLWMDAGSDVSLEAVEPMQLLRRSRVPAYSGRPVAWTLAPRGSPEAALIWKAALQTFRVVDRRVFFRLAVVLVWMVAASLFVTRVRGLAQVIGLFAAWGAGFATVMAPQVIRIDLRQDLAHLELLKTWPISGAAVVRGELAWPAILVTAIAWTFGVVALVLIGAVFPEISTGLEVAVGVSILVIIPGMVFVQYAIHNAVALFLPGWVPLGATRPRGVDAMGQRLILLGGTWLALLAALVPGAATTLVLWLTLHRVFGASVLIAGALFTTLILGVEFLAMTALLGPVYERLDITSVERPE